MLSHRYEESNEAIDFQTNLDPAREWVQLHLASNMTSGEKVVVEISFHGRLMNDMFGMYYGDYVFDGTTK